MAAGASRKGGAAAARSSGLRHKRRMTESGRKGGAPNRDTASRGSPRERTHDSRAQQQQQETPDWTDRYWHHCTRYRYVVVTDMLRGNARVCEGVNGCVGTGMHD
eukprot:GHVU01188508.1.p5 GENE.GHVU01188508.1~~GHVU01188508.1.p5  ORF type:complete len:105 (+),score=15.72 GHVU01188508.1:326-640(+)